MAGKVGAQDEDAFSTPEGSNTVASKQHKHRGGRYTTGPIFRGVDHTQDGDSWSGQGHHVELRCLACDEVMGIYDERDALGPQTDYSLAYWSAKQQDFIFPNGSQSGARWEAEARVAS